MQEPYGEEYADCIPVKCMPNVFVVKSIAGHDDVPARYLNDRVQGTQFLTDKANCPRNQTR